MILYMFCFFFLCVCVCVCVCLWSQLWPPEGVPSHLKTFCNVFSCLPPHMSHSILTSRRSGQNLTRTVCGVAAPSPTQRPLIYWSTQKALMPPVSTGNSLILACSAIACPKNSITPPVMATHTFMRMVKVKVVNGVDVRLDDIFLEHHHPAGMRGGVLPGPSYH